MYHSVIKEFDSKKCTKIVLKKGGWFDDIYYEAKIYTTKARTTIPSLEELKKLAKPILNADWKPTSLNGYKHKVSLTDHPNLIILLKPITEPKKEEKEDETN